MFFFKKSEAELLSIKRESPEAPESLFDAKNTAQPTKCLCEGVHRSGKLLVCCRLDHPLNIIRYSMPLSTVVSSQTRRAITMYIDSPLYTQLLHLIVPLYPVDMVDALDSLAVGHPHQESAFSWLDGQMKRLGACARQGCQKVLLGQLLVL